MLDLSTNFVGGGRVASFQTEKGESISGNLRHSIEKIAIHTRRTGKILLMSSAPETAQVAVRAGA